MELKGCSKRLSFCLTVLLLLVIYMNAHQVAYAATPVDVHIHYVPAPGDERDWDVWVWTNKQDGEAYSFRSDAHGAKVASFQLPAQTKWLYYIVRLPDWSARDCATERKIEITGGQAEVWLKGGTCEVSLVNPLHSEAEDVPQVDIEEQQILSVLPDAGYGGASDSLTPLLIFILSLFIALATYLRKRYVNRNGNKNQTVHH